MKYLIVRKDGHAYGRTFKKHKSLNHSLYEVNTAKKTRCNGCGDEIKKNTFVLRLWNNPDETYWCRKRKCYRVLEDIKVTETPTPIKKYPFTKEV